MLNNKSMKYRELKLCSESLPATAIQHSAKYNELFYFNFNAQKFVFLKLMSELY